MEQDANAGANGLRASITRMPIAAQHPRPMLHIIPIAGTLSNDHVKSKQRKASELIIQALEQ
jgi:hypothetical protein